MSESGDRWKLGRGKGEDVRFWFGKAKRQHSAKRPDGRAGEGGSPQVMIRVTGSADSRVAFHQSLAYFTRDATIPAETQAGRIVDGERAVRRLEMDWLGANVLHARSTQSQRQATALALSMPAGTDRDAVQDAARAWAQRNLRGYDWLLVRHDDTEHPHVHVVIRAVGHDGRRWSVHPREMQRWREDFAQELQGRGVEAAASSWRDRQKGRDHEDESGGRTR